MQSPFDKDAVQLMHLQDEQRAKAAGIYNKLKALKSESESLAVRLNVIDAEYKTLQSFCPHPGPLRDITRHRSSKEDYRKGFCTYCGLQTFVRE